MHGIIPSPFDEGDLADANPRVLSPEQYFALTDKAKLKVDLLSAVMQDILRAPKKRPAIKQAAIELVADGLTISKHRLAHLYYAWLRKGERALVDHNLCGGKCGFPECNASRASALRQETIDVWLRTAEGNDKRAFTEAWRRLIADLAAGKEIDGVGTWHDLYATTFPTKRAPEQCPWSVHRPPVGWSLKNFLARKPTRAECALAKKGIVAAKNELRKVLPVCSDTSALRFMEELVFDDHRLDFKADHEGQIVELWGLFCMDLATRTILGFGIRPRLMRADGTKESITRRDMQHLIAGVLRDYGYPKRYACKLIVENAAAAVTTECEQLLLRITQGQVVVDRTRVGGGTSLPTGFDESWGNPIDKRWLESYFNAFEVRIGDAPGQMGASWTVKRGDFEARESFGLKLAKLGLIPHLPENVAPFPSLERAFQFVTRAIHELHLRTQHRLQGFERVVTWRWSEHDPEWKTLDDPQFIRLSTEAQNALLNDPRTRERRMESPAERRVRLYDKTQFQRISLETFADLHLDALGAKYEGHDCITIKEDKRRQRPALSFYGGGHKCQLGQKVVCRLDLDRPTHVWLQDGQGRVLGIMQARRTAHRGDIAAHAEQLGQVSSEFQKIVRSVRLRHTDPAKIAQYEEALRLVKTLDLPAPDDEAATDPASAALLQQVNSTLDDAGQDHEDLYLQLHGAEADS